MTAVEIPVTKLHHGAMKRLQIVRHRMTRWFRPPEAALVRRQHPGAPLPPVASQEAAQIPAAAARRG